MLLRPVRLAGLGRAGLRTLRAILGTGLHPVRGPLRIQDAADDVVTDARQVSDTAAADHHDGVLLQVVTDTGDVGSDLIAIGQTDTGDLTQRQVC